MMTLTRICGKGEQVLHCTADFCADVAFDSAYCSSKGEGALLCWLMEKEEQSERQTDRRTDSQTACTHLSPTFSSLFMPFVRALVSFVTTSRRADCRAILTYTRSGILLLVTCLICSDRQLRLLF